MKVLFKSIIFLIFAFFLYSCNSSHKPAGQDTVEDYNLADENNYDGEKFNDANPTVIDFNATWCAPCKMIAPIFEDLEKDYSDDINFLSIDIDEDGEMAEKYNISVVPTFVFLNSDGEEIDRITGADSEGLKNKVKSLVENK